ncbi:MAG: hypothetical protein HON65_05785 [Rhodospirillales bacterium]|jgi:predicted transcriptional regulator YdeE|nr:hypothetical protein [Rhodospirillales bacterium]
MEFEIITVDEFSVCGLTIALTISQSENAKRISKLWKTFNRELQIKNIKSGKDWVKYGITLKTNGDYSYMATIPAEPISSAFEEMTISRGKFARFQHIGSLAHIKATFLDIYKKAIPQSGLVIEPERTILHYELYDRRFHWTRSDSVIDICVPVLNSGL